MGRSAVAALLLCSVLVSRADALWHLYEFFEDDSCVSFDYRSFLDAAAAPPCEPITCMATGTGTYFRVTCDLAEVTDLADGYVGKTLYSQADNECEDGPTEVEQWPIDNCVYYGSFGYRKMFCDGTGVVREYYCSSEDCDDCLSSDINDGECLPGDFGISPRRFECHAEATPVCPGASFTQEADDLIDWQIGGNPLGEAAVRPGKDCLAISLDGTVQGGWTVTYDSDEVRLRWQKYGTTAG